MVSDFEDDEACRVKKRERGAGICDSLPCSGRS